MDQQEGAFTLMAGNRPENGNSLVLRVVGYTGCQGVICNGFCFFSLGMLEYALAEVEKVFEREPLAVFPNPYLDILKSLINEFLQFSIRVRTEDFFVAANIEAMVVQMVKYLSDF